MIFMVFTRGIGIWGVNSTVVWGFAIANYVWWIGIGNAGTLISSMLLLMRQKWRASTNRFAEAMTLFAATIAGIFPIMHLGRPLYFYWLTPYPNTMTSGRNGAALSFGISGPSSATSCSRSSSGMSASFPTSPRYVTAPRPGNTRNLWRLALGWRGSARHWRVYESLHITLACLGVPLVVSLHSVVGHGFRGKPDARLAGDDLPALFRRRRDVFRLRHGGLHRRVGALGFRMEEFITIKHFDVMAKIMLTAAIIMGLSYATEWFSAWYGGDRADRNLVIFEFTGAYAPMFWICSLCNVAYSAGVLVQFRAATYCHGFVISVLINIGMWLERILIIWNTLSHDYTPSMWRLFIPTFWDWVTTFGSLGLFALMFLVFVRLIPVVSMHEVSHLAAEEQSP